LRNHLLNLVLYPFHICFWYHGGDLFFNNVHDSPWNLLLHDLGLGPHCCAGHFSLHCLVCWDHGCVDLLPHCCTWYLGLHCLICWDHGCLPLLPHGSTGHLRLHCLV
jgi:hypothetical protein